MEFLRNNVLRNKKHFISILFILLNINVLFARAEESAPPALFQMPQTIVQAPELSLPNLHEKVEKLSDYHGKVILLHFWATWCVSCLEELPELQILWEKLQDKGLVVIAVAEDSWKAVQAFVKKEHFTFPIWVDQYGQGLRHYSVKGFPATYLIGRDGTVQGLAMGFRQWTEPKIFNAIESLVNIER